MAALNPTMEQLAEMLQGLPAAERQALIARLQEDHVAQRQRRKRVNGFMGFRSHYSAQFSHLPQKMRSPILTALWRSDAFHAQWDFLSSVYSDIRGLLQHENKHLRDWIEYAIPQLGLTHGNDYMRTYGWDLITGADGSTFELIRVPDAQTPVPAQVQPLPAITSLELYLGCVSRGLRLKPQSHAIAVRKLTAGAHNNMMVIHAPVGPPPPAMAEAMDHGNNSKQMWQTLAAMDPASAMAVLFRMPVEHEMFNNGVDFYELDETNDLLDIVANRSLDNNVHHPVPQLEPEMITYQINMENPQAVQYALSVAITQENIEGHVAAHPEFFIVMAA